MDRETKELIVSAKAELASRYHAKYCQYIDRAYQLPKHLQLINSKLDEVAKGNNKRIMISVPPRHGKSETVSRRFPSYYIGRRPDDSIILSSYAYNLAKGFSRVNRDTISSRRYKTVFPISLSREAKAVNDWNIANHRGGFIASGVGGSITGHGAHLFIIDDPVKNKEEAESITYREKTWDWYTSVVLTRIEPGGSILLIMTRWHQDDLAGRILKNEKDWEVINLSAIAGENDILGRKPGEALWPERYDEDRLSRIKQKVGSRVWWALYQGEPQDPESQIIRREWFQLYDALPPECERGGGIDTATSKKTTADNTSLVDVCRDPKGYYYVDDVFLGKLSVSGFANVVSNAHSQKKYTRIVMESNNAGEAMKQRIDEVGREHDTHPPVTLKVTSTDKVVRVHEFSHMIENGTLKFKRGNPRVAALMDHLVNFDGLGGDVDDDVDALGFAIKAVLKKEDHIVITSTEDFDVF